MFGTHVSGTEHKPACEPYDRPTGAVHGSVVNGTDQFPASDVHAYSNGSALTRLPVHMDARHSKPVQVSPDTLASSLSAAFEDGTSAGRHRPIL